jgi:hypothetical protein
MRKIESSRTSLKRKIARHLMILIAVFVILSALAIWLGLGPVVLSA